MSRYSKNGHFTIPIPEDNCTHSRTDNERNNFGFQRQIQSGNSAVDGSCHMNNFSDSPNHGNDSPSDRNSGCFDDAATEDNNDCCGGGDSGGDTGGDCGGSSGGD